MSTPSRHVSVVVHVAAGTAYRFAADPRTLPRWAVGLAHGVVPLPDGRWATDGPLGRVEVAFTAPNELGVLDHVVTLPDGTAVLNPFRVLVHPDGCELLFTLRPAAGVTAEAFEADAAAVEADLLRLKALLESEDAAAEPPGGPHQP